VRADGSASRVGGGRRAPAAHDTAPAAAAPSSPLAARPARIRVPGSSSNLGAGFDCVGVAVTRYLSAGYVPTPDTPGLRVERRGTLRALDDRPDTHDLFVRAFTRTLDIVGAPQPAGTLTLDSEIPIGRGLGSSAAAVVGAIALALTATELPLSTEFALRVAHEFEKHLDNVAPSLFGGLVAVARDHQGVPHAFSLPLSDRIGLAFAAPGVELETKRARAALPRQVAFGDAVHNLGALAALTRALAIGDRQLLELGFLDRLHVRYRIALIPGADAAIAAARAAGAWGATVSGAGSGLIAVTDPARAADVADAMAGAFRHAAGPHGVVFFAVEPAVRGIVSE
jgi:homoserine kinase